MTTNLVYLPIDCLYPHPDNPRKELGDLTELADSIKAKGVLQNLTVVKGHAQTQEEWLKYTALYNENPSEELREKINAKWYEDGYTIIIGHRRTGASKIAGLTVVPCVIVDMTPEEQVTTMLLENMQRSDLTVYEHAQGFQMLLNFGTSIEEIASKSGFSTTTVRRRIKMCELDQNRLKTISAERQLSLTDFDELAKIEDIKQRNKLLEKLGTSDFNYALKEALQKQIVNKNLPKALELLKKLKAKEIKDNEIWSGHYEEVTKVIDLTKWEKTKEYIPETSSEKLYYTKPGIYGTFRIYKKKHIEKAPKKTEQQIQREKRIKEAWDFVLEQSALLYEMRKEFIEALKVTAKNEKTILQGLLYRTAFSAIGYMYCDKTSIAKLFNLEDAGVYSRDRNINIYRALDSLANDDLAKFVYYSFDDSKDYLFIETTDYRHNSTFPSYEPNGKLLALYKWLELLGYETSGIEKSLLDGTHQIYQTWKDESAALSEALS